MRRIGLLLALVSLMCATPVASQAACGACKAEQVTTATANSLLFGGTDAAGGVNDWYLTNGTIVAIIDDIDTVPIPVASGTPPEFHITSSNAVETGGTLVDLGLKGKNNDQMPQSFNTGGLSLANVFIFREGDEVPWLVPSGNNPCATVGASNAACPLDVVGDPTQADCAAVTVYGIMLGTCKTPTDFCSTRTSPKLRVRTTYKACKGSRSLHMRTEVWNLTGNPQTLPIFDVFLWGGRGLVPFAADRGRGFTHPELDLSSAGAIIGALTSSPYFAVPGNVGTKDGNFARGKKAGSISYGYVSDNLQTDADGPTGPGAPTLTAPGFVIQSLQATLLSAALTSLLPPSLPNGDSRIFNRHVVVGARNDVASVVGDKNNPESILAASGLAAFLGTVSGKISPGSKQEGTITFVRVGGTDLAPFGFPTLNRAPISSVRTKGSFSNVQLPKGDYIARAVIPGQDDYETTSFTVTEGANTVVPSIPLTKLGTLKIEVRDADTNTGIPAKISLSPSPSMRRDLAAFTYGGSKRCSNNIATSCNQDSDCGAGNTCVIAGMCSNAFGTPCFLDATCGGGNTCFRTCSNVEPQPCSPGCAAGYTCASDNKCRKNDCANDAACGAGNICVADTSDNLPESYPGGQGQMHVIYADAKGKAQVDMRPGSYTLTVSRGIEYTIRKVDGDPTTPLLIDNVTIATGATTDVGVQTIKRVVTTADFLSADFHIHSGRSLDSSAPPEARVRSFAGEGLEVMVSTDHDINTDYSPFIKKLKMDAFIRSIVGTEVTTSVPRAPFIANGWGHINSWPSIYDANLRRSGSVEDESVSASTIYDRLRLQSDLQCVGGKNNTQACTTAGASCSGGGTCTDVGEQVVQMNHPRAGIGGVVNIGIFDNIGYNPAKDITDCQKYPVLCSSSSCAGGTNDGTSCTSDAQCTGGGRCGCGGGSIPGAAGGCNDILNDLNVIPQATRCTSPGCGGGFEGANGTRNIDFDVMEIDNGGTVGGFGNLKLVRRDWLSILNQGIEVGKATDQHQLWGTGVSDSHRLVAEIPAYSRTYVGAGELPVPPATLDVKAFNQEILGGKMVATAGPYIEFTVDNGGAPVGIGDTLTGGGSVDLNIIVKAAPWIPVDEVRIIKNGCVVACYNHTDSTPTLNANPADPYEQVATNVERLNTTITDTVTGDSYYIIEASPSFPASGDPPVDAIVNSVAASVFPYGFTNPIFVDGTDLDSDYTGIGLPPGAGEPTSCPALLPSSGICSAGAAIAAATLPRTTMFADAPQPKGWFARLLDRLVGPAVAGDGAPAEDADAARARKHEEELRKPNPDSVPWHLIEFPTPAPTPAAPQQ